MMDAFEAWLPKLEDIEYRRANGEPEYQNIGFDSLEIPADCQRIWSRQSVLSERFKERYAKRMINCETLPGWQIRLQNRMDEIAQRYEFAYELMEKYRASLPDDVMDGYHDIETTSDELSGTDTQTRSGTDTSAASGTDTTEDDSTTRNIDTPDSATNADPAYADSRQDDDRDITTTYGRTDTRTLDLEDATEYGKRRDIERDLRRVLTGNALEKISGGIRSYTDIDTMFVQEFENNFLNIFWYRGVKMARISLVEQYDNRDVIAQILRIREDLLDTVEKAEISEADDVCTLKVTYKDGREESFSWDSSAGAYVQEAAPEVSEGALWFKPSESILYVGMGMGWFPVTSPIEVDDELSETSENPVQNKVITAALDDVSGFKIEDMGTYYLMTDGGNATLTDMGTYWELSWI